MSRTSYSQFAQIVDFMERNGDLSTPGNTALGRFTAATKWEELTDILNSDGSGMPKKVDKWKKVWSDYKNNTKKKAKRIQRATCCPEGGPKHVAPLTDLEKRVLVLTHNELLQTPNLSLVMQCCISLIQSHGSVVERVIDDPAFQKILTLTPLTAEERGRVTSEGVRGMMEGEEEDCEETDTSEVQEHANETETQDPTAIKDEIGVIHWQCSCDEISGHHDDACAAAAVDYLEHYRDDAEIPNAPPSPPSIKLINVDPLDQIPPANKKRKLDPAADNEPIITQHDASSLDRFKSIDHKPYEEFKSLDQFGLYVASLLKLLPRKRCIKYQNQIVDRLLKDLAAAA